MSYGIHGNPNKNHQHFVGPGALGKSWNNEKDLLFPNASRKAISQSQCGQPAPVGSPSDPQGHGH